jgi:hypothetical protein
MNPRPQSRQLPPWHECYRAALLESDRSQVPGRISVAMNTLIQHLKGTNDGEQRRERDRILQALRMLELLQRVSGDVASPGAAASSFRESHFAS